MLGKNNFALALAALSWLAAYSASAQDERFFRKIFTDELQVKKTENLDFKVSVSAPEYLVDLNRDGRKEVLVIEKKDGLDFFRIKDRFGRTRFETKLMSKGIGATLYKARLVTVSSVTDALILYFYEGYSGQTVFKGTARLYFLTIENRSLENIYLARGPAYFLETEKPENQYNRRFYNVNIVDYNNDGRKEISINYNKIQRIYFYRRKGLWDKL